MNEWLIFDGLIVPANKFEQSFFRGDVGINGSLTFDEFTSTYPGKQSLVNVRRFFLRADVNLDSSISMDEYLNLRSGTTAPGTFYTTF